ncbi:DUF1360 domain-containing protein [Halobacillus campisalis]|uniref:DUF1360 domain-containing protein n=1 Tax=Halobacillus campisalis TaxID=435909 RepID=A0ABW2K692_9BACI|nr:DUF1360 domain-containing protein [Halobacillus campisalis]
MISWMELFLMAFACFRLTRLIVQDVIFEPFRVKFFHVVNKEGEEWLEPKGVFGELLSCQWCVGMWMSLFVSFLYFYVPYSYFFILVMALAGIQSLLYTWTDR